MSINLPPDPPELQERLDRYPYEYELAAHAPIVIRTTPRYPRAFVLGVHFDCRAIEELWVHGLEMEHHELLPISPVPARSFNEAHSLILPVAHASGGLSIKLRSNVPQRVTVRVHFSECRRGEPRA